MRNSPQDLRKKIFGRTAESDVRTYLKRHGYKILARNYKTPFGEADIVAMSPDDYICFVEVKARTSDAYGSPMEAVTPQKQQRYRQIARYWCNAVREEVSVRFDVAAVCGDKIEYLENAFE